MTLIYDVFTLPIGNSPYVDKEALARWLNETATMTNSELVSVYSAGLQHIAVWKRVEG